jgi:propanol-preferring alcohol dehydrogenase
MQAVRFAGVGRPAQIEDVLKPAAGPGQVLIKIGGAGVCHSDLHVMEEDLGFTPPFTHGHENAGWVAALGQGVARLKEGDAVAVYGPWGCGRCHACQLSMENYCESWAQMDHFGGEPETTAFPLAQAVDVYRKLKAGHISGRAVLIPEGAAA